jgi:hypothetical protein
LLSGTPLQSSPSLTESTELATKARCALFQASDFDDATYFAAALAIAAALFALSYWLLHSSHQRHRQAH